MNSLDCSSVKISAACFGCGLASGFLINKLVDKLRAGNRDDDETQPEKWVRVGTVSQLVIYPVKSLAGVNVQEASVTDLGLMDAENPLLRDRVFLVTDEKWNFKTQRTLPNLALIQATVKDNTVILRVNNRPGEVISVPVPSVSDSSPVVIARIFAEKVKGVDCGEKVGEWLTKVTQSSEPLRLVYHATEGSQRNVTLRQRQFPVFSSKDLGTFQDETAYMLMTQESMDALNEKCKEPFSMKSFRPSIFLTGVSEPWAEDFWGFIRIGDDSDDSPVLKASMPCERCKLTTVNPETGKIREDGEPLATLRTIKRKRIGDAVVTKIVEKSAIMGAHFGLYKGNDLKIRVGDPVYAALL